MVDNWAYYRKLKRKLQKKEVFVTFDAAEYAAAAQKLEQASIPIYLYRVWKPAGRISSLGENVAKQTEYQIYVSNSDYEDAVYCIQKR